MKVLVDITKPLCRKVAVFLILEYLYRGKEMKETLKRMWKEFWEYKFYGGASPIVQTDPEPALTIDDEQKRYPFNVKYGDSIVGEILLKDGEWKFASREFTIGLQSAAYIKALDENQLTQILAKVKKLNESKDGKTED